MLLFKKKFISLILKGQKTQTIRLWKHCRFKSGQRSYTPGVGYIRVESIEQVTLESLTDDDAILDGFETASALKEEIQSIYGEKIEAGYKPFKVRFSILPEAEQERIKAEKKRQKKQKKTQKKYETVMAELREMAEVKN
ncbi:MAG: ASCH domain-containing protein [Thermoguttaceae bacterium]